jgi:hypothetical protein
MTDAMFIVKENTKRLPTFIKGKKVKLSLCLTKYQAMKTYPMLS